jgi:hypothetical protein
VPQSSPLHRGPTPVPGCAKESYLGKYSTDTEIANKTRKLCGKYRTMIEGHLIPFEHDRIEPMIACVLRRSYEAFWEAELERLLPVPR